MVSNCVQVLENYLDLMDAQRRGIFLLLEHVPQAYLWKKPRPTSWSAGEHIDHARVLTRAFRRLITCSWPMLKTVAWLRHSRPIKTEIDDVYERPGFPNGVGWMWPPNHTTKSPVPLATLAEAMAQEHCRIRSWYEAKDVSLLGQANLCDPAIGWINLIQALRIGIYHDAHHFRIAERLINSYK